MQSNTPEARAADNESSGTKHQEALRRHLCPERLSRRVTRLYSRGAYLWRAHKGSSRRGGPAGGDSSALDTRHCCPSRPALWLLTYKYNPPNTYTTRTRSLSVLHSFCTRKIIINFISFAHDSQLTNTFSNKNVLR